jgi:hypothetical protein
MRFACEAISKGERESRKTHLEYDLHHILHRRRHLQPIQPPLQATLQIDQHIPQRSFRRILCRLHHRSAFRGGEKPFLDLG